MNSLPDQISGNKIWQNAERVLQAKWFTAWRMVKDGILNLNDCLPIAFYESDVCLFFLGTLAGCGMQPDRTINDAHLQQVPGRIEFEQYNTGGEGVGYHDADSINNGSGKLNPPDGDSLNEFRMTEGGDISYTKSGGIDDNPFNRVNVSMGSLYLGWTEPGEWFDYTLDVKDSGSYTASLQYTAHSNGSIMFEVDGKNQTGQLPVASTYDASDTVAWRQWHHWDRIDSLCVFRLEKGIHVLRLNIVTAGNMNFDYMLLTSPVLVTGKP